MAVYIGASNTARKVKGIYVGVDGVARKVTKGYIGVDGTARTILSAGFGLGDLPLGSIVMINESGTPKPFYLATHNYEPELNGSGRCLLVRKRGYPEGVNLQVYWHNLAPGKTYPTQDTYSLDYAVGNLDDVLTAYKDVLDTAVQTAIGSTTFYYTNGADSRNNNFVLTTLSRPVFQLSLGELFNETDLAGVELIDAYKRGDGTKLPTAELLRSIYNPSSTGGESQGKLWTRSPATFGGNSPAVWGVDYDLLPHTHGRTKDAWARPSFTLPATAPVNPEPNADGSYTLALA